MVPAHTDPARLLRSALRANAAFSTLSALPFLFACEAVAAFLGVVPPRQVLFLGIQLAVFAACLFWLASRPTVSPWKVWIIISLDLLWVVGSFQAIVAGPPALTPAGKLAIAFVADVVALFALLQFLGLRRMRAAAPSA